MTKIHCKEIKVQTCKILDITVRMRLFSIPWDRSSEYENNALMTRVRKVDGDVLVFFLYYFFIVRRYASDIFSRRLRQCTWIMKKRPSRTAFHLEIYLQYVIISGMVRSFAFICRIQYPIHVIRLRWSGCVISLCGMARSAWKAGRASQCKLQFKFSQVLSNVETLSWSLLGAAYR